MLTAEGTPVAPSRTIPVQIPDRVISAVAQFLLDKRGGRITVHKEAPTNGVPPRLKIETTLFE